MGEFTAYALHTAIFLLAGYIIYKWLMAGEKQAAFNRWLLLGIYAVAFAAMPMGALLQRSASTGAGGTADISIEGLIMLAAPAEAAPIWPQIIVGVYLAGAAAVLLWSLVVVLRLSAIIRSGEHREGPEGTHLIVLDNRSVAPFSWHRYIVINRDDYEAGGEIITAHELAHIRHRHGYDLIIAQAVCVLQWFNPAAWLMREELKSVHEFQADDTVLASGIEARQYQMLLIKKAVGTRFQSLANSLNHSNLKKRITMMYNQKSTGGRRLRGLALVPALALALAVTNLPAVASVLSATSAADFSTHSESAAPKAEAPAAVSDSKITEKTEDVQAADLERMPQYPGGEAEMFHFLADNLKYPKEAEEKGAEGRVVLTFRILPDGSVSDITVLQSVDPALDAEAVRVAGLMPKWTPGIADGKPVAVTYTLPVTFKLPKDKAGKEKKAADPVVVSYGTIKKNDTTTTGQIIKIQSNDNGQAKGEPAIFVNGKLFEGNLTDIIAEDIESITVIKNREDFPNGLIEITLKPNAGQTGTK